MDRCLPRLLLLSWDGNWVALDSQARPQFLWKLFSDLAYKALTRKLQSSALFWIDKLWVGNGNLAFSLVTGLLYLLLPAFTSLLVCHVYPARRTGRQRCQDVSGAH